MSLECREQVQVGVDRRWQGFRIILVQRQESPGAVAQALAQGGAELHVAPDSEAAVESMLAADRLHRPIDLLLVEMDEAAMDASQVARSLRAFGYEGLIIAMAAAPTSGDCESCLYSGCDDLVYLPVSPKTLWETFYRLRLRLDGSNIDGSASWDRVLPF